MARRGALKGGVKKLSKSFPFFKSVRFGEVGERREREDASTGCVTDSDVTADGTELALFLSEGKTRKLARTDNMAECSYASCALDRRTIRKSLQSWTKTMVHIVGESF